MTHPAQPKSLAVAYLLLFFLGVFGAHYFYLGVTRRAIVYLLTLGCLGFGVLIDLFTLPGEVRRTNQLIMSGQPHL
ncbi:TM2 domain-containing protein [Micromonospora sp. C95]|uniref:TM2 domain-containing protein n=1 Tax=Micromonospora sp. C95 TaxID=2824882 RepID=UPI001B36C461|nr:TM2 domain-containing protein [Micromonospora sp. C95]MBQ1023947.1 TM2 domain-containing protein [Micromonospora sp. C95]